MCFSISKNWWKVDFKKEYVSRGIRLYTKSLDNDRTGQNKQVYGDRLEEAQIEDYSFTEETSRTHNIEMEEWNMMKEH
ncbi:hypothetical protein Lal_00024785 [Lupinus albus]|nr:hypothetical protein Lal_00024785 [Lupinus albus]